MRASARCRPRASTRCARRSRRRRRGGGRGRGRRWARRAPRTRPSRWPSCSRPGPRRRARRRRSTRWRKLGGAGALTAPRAFEVLDLYAGHRAPEIRQRAVKALGTIKDPRATCRRCWRGWATRRPGCGRRPARRWRRGASRRRRARLFALVKKSDAGAASPLAALATPDLVPQIAELAGSVDDGVLATTLGEYAQRGGRARPAARSTWCARSRSWRAPRRRPRWSNTSRRCRRRTIARRSARRRSCSTSGRRCDERGARAARAAWRSPLRGGGRAVGVRDQPVQAGRQRRRGRRRAGALAAAGRRPRAAWSFLVLGGAAARAWRPTTSRRRAWSGRSPARSRRGSRSAATSSSTAASPAAAAPGGRRRRRRRARHRQRRRVVAAPARRRRAARRLRHRRARGLPGRAEGRRDEARAPSAASSRSTRATETVRWRHELPTGRVAGPAVRGGLVAVPVDSQYVILLDGATGSELAQVLSTAEAATFVRALPEGMFYGSRGVFLLSPSTARGSRAGAGLSAGAAAAVRAAVLLVRPLPARAGAVLGDRSQPHPVARRGRGRSRALPRRHRRSSTTTGSCSGSTRRRARCAGPTATRRTRSRRRTRAA